MTSRKRPQQIKQPAGSPDKGEPAFIVIGKLRKPHGLRGEIIMEIMTDFPERIHAGQLVYAGDEHLPLRIRGYRIHQHGLLVSFQEYTNREEVGELRNQMLFVNMESIPPLEDGDYYHHQILGLDVVNDTGESLGIITEILDTGANDVLLVRPEKGADILIPVVDSVIQEVDLENGRMSVKLLPGILAEG